MKNQKKTAITRLGQRGQILSQRFRPLLFSLVILLLLTAAALAQLTTDILGTVTDQTGASVPKRALPSRTWELTTNAPSSPTPLATTPSRSFPSDTTRSQ
jgi:hypothetical protein